MDYFELTKKEQRKRFNLRQEMKRQVDALPKNKANRRIFTEKLRKQYAEEYKKGSVYKNPDDEHSEFYYLEYDIQVDINVFTRWGRVRTDRRKVGRPKKSTVTALKAPSIAAGGRTIGTNLSTILTNMKDNDVLQQVTMVDTLEEAGYKREAVIEKIDGPSMEDLTKIMDAVKLLSEQYTITKKETK